MSSRGSGRSASSTSERCAGSRASTSTTSRCACRASTPRPSSSPGGQRQAIAVARAVRAATKILLLDEPLAAMGARESRLIIDLVKDLASSGRVSIIVIDHNYAHLFELCDRINVMQGGRITIDQHVRETSLEELTELMISSYRQATRRGPERAVIGGRRDALGQPRGLVRRREPGDVRRRAALQQVEAHAAEIAAGLDAAGRDPGARRRPDPSRRRRSRSAPSCSRPTRARACVGVIAWMHTFSPAKMWIAGLAALAASRSCISTRSSTATCPGRRSTWTS